MAINGIVLGQKEAERTLFLEYKDCSRLLTYCPTKETFEEEFFPAFEELYTKLYDDKGHKKYQFVVIDNRYIITQHYMQYYNNILLVDIQMEDIKKEEIVFMGTNYSENACNNYWCNYSKISQSQTIIVTKQYAILGGLTGYKNLDKNFIWIISDIIKEDEDEDVEISFKNYGANDTQRYIACSRIPTSPITINYYVIGSNLIYSLHYPI